MLSRFDFYKGQLDHLFVLVEKVLSFFQEMKLDFLRQSESIYFCNHWKCF